MRENQSIKINEKEDKIYRQEKRKKKKSLSFNMSLKEYY